MLLSYSGPWPTNQPELSKVEGNVEREGRDRVKAVQREAQVLVGTSGVEDIP